MKKDSWRPVWHPITNSEAHAITGSTESPNQVFPYSIDKLPTQLQKFPGLYGAYITGYATSSISPEGVSILGEVVTVRKDGEKGKVMFLFSVYLVVEYILMDLINISTSTISTILGLSQ